jgi:hypothetical protein
MARTLGDAWASENPTPESSNVMSLDYYRSKVTEYQSTLNALDSGYQAALVALDVPGLDPQTYSSLSASIDEFQSKRWSLKATAEAINMGAAAVNAAGGRMPELSIPGTLGFLPFALPIAAIVAVGTAATLIVWGQTWLRGVNERLKTAMLLEAQATPEDKAALAVAIQQSDQAVAMADASGLSALAPILKWGAIGIGAFMLWRAFGSRGTR